MRRRRCSRWPRPDLRRGAGAYINRISGALLVVAGVWISWFWITSLTSGAASLGESSAFRFVEDLSQRAINIVADNTLAVGVVLGAVIALAGLTAWRGGASAVDNDEPEGSDKAPAGLAG